MRLNCPACTAVLDLSETLVKKLVRCPKCEQNFVVPEAPSPVTAPREAPKGPVAPDHYEMTENSPSEHIPKPQNPNQLKFCPGCGAPWKKGSKECAKCHYVAALGAQLKPKEKKKFNLNFDTQKVWLFVFVVGVIFGLFMLITKWHIVKGWINSFLG